MIFRLLRRSPRWLLWWIIGDQFIATTWMLLQDGWGDPRQWDLTTSYGAFMYHYWGAAGRVTHWSNVIDPVFGFGLALRKTSPSTADAFQFIIVVPIWAVYAALTIAVAPSAIRQTCRSFRIRSAIRRNHCVSCGYDLCASVDRCPECGSAIRHRSQIQE